MKKFFFILLLAATVAHAEIYKWTDKEGTVHFSDSLEQVPANYRKSTQPIEMDTNETTVKNKTVSPIEPPQSANDHGSVAPNVGSLKDRMMKDERIMALIRAMRNDQELQVLLSDQAIMRAIQAGDISTLLNNPDFLKILNNPRIKEIEKRLNHSGTK
ncbi:MAG: DUF4124 domain-containing protein [Desulfatiglandaceae bacterium]|jgi:hypothetical protein